VSNDCAVEALKSNFSAVQDHRFFELAVESAVMGREVHRRGEAACRLTGAAAISRRRHERNGTSAH
jgi:hypothetical protein